MYFDILIVGGSAAGFYTAQHLVDLGFDGSIGVISNDPDAPYDRTKLSKELLFDGATSENIVIERGRISGCEWLSGVTATGLDVESSQVWTDVHGPIGFGRLVIATGASPRLLSVSGSPVSSLYTLADALALRSRLTELAQVTVVGSGFIAAETASGLANLGIDVQLIVRRGLFVKYGGGIETMARSLFTRRGVAIVQETAGNLVRPESCGHVGELTVCAIGSEPAVRWLGEFALSRGSVIRTDPVGLVDGSTNTFAVGDVAWRWNSRHREYVRAGHWASAIADARVTAAFLTTGETRQNARGGLQGFSSTHFGVTLQGIGNVSIADEIRCDGDYRTEGWAAARFFHTGKLCAVISYGRPEYIMEALPKLLADAS